MPQDNKRLVKAEVGAIKVLNTEQLVLETARDVSLRAGGEFFGSIANAVLVGTDADNNLSSNTNLPLFTSFNMIFTGGTDTQTFTLPPTTQCAIGTTFRFFLTANANGDDDVITISTTATYLTGGIYLNGNSGATNGMVTGQSKTSVQILNGQLGSYLDVTLVDRESANSWFVTGMVLSNKATGGVLFAPP